MSKRRETYESAQAQPVRHRAPSDGTRIIVNRGAVAAVIVAFATGIAAGVVIASTLLGSAVESSLKMAPHGLPACATEDSVGCYWDAETMGNGQGHDVVVLP